jgi:hypothetical protein
MKTKTFTTSDTVYPRVRSFREMRLVAWPDVRQVEFNINGYSCVLKGDDLDRLVEWLADPA